MKHVFVTLIAVLTASTAAYADEAVSASSSTVSDDASVGPEDVGVMMEATPSVEDGEIKMDIENSAPAKQVGVEAKVAETSASSDRSLGLDFSDNSAFENDPEGAEVFSRLTAQIGQMMEQGLPNNIIENQQRIAKALIDDGASDMEKIIASALTENGEQLLSDPNAARALAETLGGDSSAFDPNMAPEVVEFEGYTNYGSPITGTAGDDTSADGNEPPKPDRNRGGDLVQAGEPDEFAGKSIEFLELEHATCTMSAMSARASMGYITSTYGDDPEAWDAEIRQDYESADAQAQFNDNCCTRLENKIAEMKGS